MFSDRYREAMEHEANPPTVSELIRYDAQVACSHTVPNHPFEYLAEGQPFKAAKCGCCRGSGWFVSSWDTWETCPCGIVAEHPEVASEQFLYEEWLNGLSDLELFQYDRAVDLDEARQAWGNELEWQENAEARALEAQLPF